MLAACHLSTKDCLQMCVEKLLENLKKYPQVKLNKSESVYGKFSYIKLLLF